LKSGKKNCEKRRKGKKEKGTTPNWFGVSLSKKGMNQKIGVEKGPQ